MAERKWTGKSKGTKTGYKIFVLFIQYFGLAATYCLLFFVAFYYVCTSWKLNSHIYRYFKILGFNRIKSSFGLFRNYFSFGQSLIDKIAIMANFQNKFTFQFEGEYHLEDMIKAGKGGILLGAHVGNWDIAGHYLDRLDTPINIVMYDAEYAKLKDYLDSITGKKNARIILIKDDFAHIYQILEALEKNELICIHADRLVETSNKHITLPFLTEQASFPYNVFKLIVMFKVPVSFVFAFKESWTKYHFFATPGKLYAGNEKESDIKSLAIDYVSNLEEKIKLYPYQWYNYFNFWENNTAC